MALARVRLIDGSDGAREVPRPHPIMLQLAVIDEVFAHASEEQAFNFFVAVGRRMGARLVLPADDRLAVFEQAINGFWQRLRLGQVTLAIDDDGIVIDHIDYTAASPTGSSTWPKAAAGVILGAYTAWFQPLGDEVPLQTRLIERTNERIIIHHGL